MDLVSVNFYGNSISLLTNNGSGTFSLSPAPTLPPRPTAIAAADVNGDGKMDLIVASSVDDSLRILTNSGNGTFTISSAPSIITPLNPNGGGATSIATADVNGDGKVDLICADYSLWKPRCSEHAFRCSPIPAMGNFVMTTPIWRGAHRIP